MTFTCDAEVYDAQTGVSFQLVANPSSNAEYGLSCAVIKEGKRRDAFVRQLDLSGDYIRALMMLGHDFDLPCVGIFVPLAGDGPIIGRWQTAFEAAGLKEQLVRLDQRQGMKFLEHASQDGYYTTQPAIGRYTRPEELLEGRRITLIRLKFTR